MVLQKTHVLVAYRSDLFTAGYLWYVQVPMRLVPKKTPKLSDRFRGFRESLTMGVNIQLRRVPNKQGPEANGASTTQSIDRSAHLGKQVEFMIGSLIRLRIHE